jgi:hypothetical protein
MMPRGDSRSQRIFDRITRQFWRWVLNMPVSIVFVISFAMILCSLPARSELFAGELGTKKLGDSFPLVGRG